MKKRPCIAALALMACAMAWASQETIDLDHGWHFKQARGTNWHPATVPGVVHTDLMAAGLIEDPFFRLNERGVQWVDKEDWEYVDTISLTPQFLRYANIDLECDGLDTYADVYVNGTKVLEANNMHRRWQTPVKELLKPGENVIKVYFHSPVKVDMPKWEALPYHYEADNDQSANGGLLDRRLSVFARKAGYHYGWDWGPRLVTSGIWRPMRLVGWDGAKIADVHVQQLSVDRKRADIDHHVQIMADSDMPGATVRVVDLGTGHVLASKAAPLAKGDNTVSVPYAIKNPRLWWTNGLGTPERYQIATYVINEADTIDSTVTTTGLRDLQLVTEPDGEGGLTFYFKLNGEPLFAKGANYIPQDNFLPRLTEADYRRTIEDARDVNMNMLRVWGGGIYEDDMFYDLCDEMGILVWQDFMFACSVYPAEGELLENIRLEAIDNVKRLRNHPSIAIWCGGNECQEAWFNWGWERKYEQQSPEYAERIRKQFVDQYFVTLPAVVEEYHPGVRYWPSSPSHGKMEQKPGNQGDSHYWGVWHAVAPISDYDKVTSHFFSEYGFQAFPEYESVKIYAPNPEDHDITSEVMMAHQRGGAGANDRIRQYLLNEYREPRDFEQFLYVNHVLQGDAIKTAMESHRRQMPYCMGSLFWQHNDCWPVASWSSRDYYGRWKAQHYFARKAYAPLLISGVDNDGEMQVSIVSDLLTKRKADVDIRLIALDGEVLGQWKSRASVAPNSVTPVWSMAKAELLAGRDPGEVVLVANAKIGADEVSNIVYMCQQKQLRLPVPQIATQVQERGDGLFDITVSSDTFARAVHLSVDGIDNRLSDNYFDILPGESVTVTLTAPLSLQQVRDQLKINTLATAYK